MKVYSTREFIQILKKNGFTCNRKKGDHLIFKNGTKSVTINRGLNRMVAQRLIKENNLEVGK